MQKILYIHGFASTGQTSKVDHLKAMTGVEVIAPNLSHDPIKDITMLQSIVRTENITTVVGSSLGGFYALFLAQRFDLGLVLINPALRPYDTLFNRIGEVAIYGTDTTFSWTLAKCDELCMLSNTTELALSPHYSSVDWAKALVLIAEKDELLNVPEMMMAFPKHNVRVDDKADHRFADIMPWKDDILSVVNAKSSPIVPESVLK